MRVLQKEKFTDTDTVYSDLQNAFQRAAESQENRIYIIKGQTALGKTSTYIEFMKKSLRPVLIAVPTYELKEQIIRDAKDCGVNDICVTPDITSFVNKVLYKTNSFLHIFNRQIVISAGLFLTVVLCFEV
ncbi:MAG: DEAD/DEAH box helicase family protein [Ruminococcus sp.]